MSLFAIGDTHLTFGSNKPMDVFSGWQDYEKRLEKNWKNVVSDEDTVVIAGDISWAMHLEDALEDLRFIDRLPGKKILMKGNHDYWWETKKKLDDFISQHGLTTLHILFNNAYLAHDIGICGTRGWFFDCGQDEDKKVVLREAGRLKRSIECALELGGKPTVFLHYPPLSMQEKCSEIYDVLKMYDIRQCYYGHLHGKAHYAAVNGEQDGIKFSLISGDYLGFCPKLIEKY